MTSSIMCNAAIPLRRKEEHLILPIIAVQGPAVGKDDCFASRVTPIFVVDLSLVTRSYERHCDDIKVFGEKNVAA